jgi:hypothetical protein
LVQTEKFIQGQTKEALEFEVYDASDPALAVIDISVGEVDDIIFRLFTSNNQTLLATGKYSTGEITYVTDGTDGKCLWSPEPTDLDVVGTHEGELVIEFTADSRDAIIQEMIIKIKAKAPIV